MTNRTEELTHVLARVGLGDGEISDRQKSEVAKVVDAAKGDPLQAAVDLVIARKQLKESKRSTARAAEAATKLEAILESLLKTDPILCRLEGLTGHNPARALCRVNGQLRELPVHTSVEVAELRALEPWDYVSVRPDELMVVGCIHGEDLLDRSRGEIAEFKGYLDRSRGLVRVTRQGHEESIVTLSRRLVDIDLVPSDKLVLLHGDERWAIDRIEGQHETCRFEVPIDLIDTRLHDLAGLDSIIEPLLEDVILRMLHPDLRSEFGLRPLNGLLLSSAKPGMGKTALMRALAVWLQELGVENGFDVVLYVVKPCELKSVWHGGDAHLVRDELCGSIRARQARPRTRQLFQLVVLDEVESLGKRGGSEAGAGSSAHNDAAQALLAEMDGMIQGAAGDGPPANVLWCGLTNRVDMLDDALKRPGRFGDCVLEVPQPTKSSAEAILAIYGRGASIPWLIDGDIRNEVSEEELRALILRPAVAAIFDQVVLQYWTDGRAAVDVSAGELMANVHFTEAMNTAKKRAARRKLLGTGLPAASLDDVIEGLVSQACSAAGQMSADIDMLARQLQIQERVTRAQALPEEELSSHRYLRGEQS